MTDLKLLLTTYSTAFLTSGGGESEMVQVAELLNEGGAIADVYGLNSRPLGYYDAILHFSVASDGVAILQKAREKRKTIFLWPSVWFQTNPTFEEVIRIREFTGLASCLVFKSEAERAHFSKFIGEISSKIYVVPAGIPDCFLTAPDSALLQTICGLDNYVLCVGLIEPVKNQLEVIRALNRLGINGLFVGGVRDEKYYQMCMLEAGKNMKMLPFLQPQSALLRAAMGNAIAVVEPSFDPPGRSCIEAAMMNRPLVLLDTPWCREHFDDAPYYSKSAQAEDLAVAIRHAITDNGRFAKIESTYSRVLSRHGGGAATKRLLDVLGRELR